MEISTPAGLKAPKATQNLGWRRDSGFITLRAVEIYLAKRLLAIRDILNDCHADFMDAGRPDKQVAEKAVTRLQTLADEASRIDLPMTAKFARKIASHVGFRDAKETFDEITVLEERFDDELESIHLFLVKSGRFIYFNNRGVASPTFESAFPESNSELIEAGNCLVFDRYKACVFHCCLALEGGLIALGTRLKVKPQDNWGGWIQAIRNELKGRYTPKKNRNRQLYAECVERFDAIRISRRNPASHFGMESTYSETEAKEIFDATVVFLRHVETMLKPLKAKSS